MMEFLIKNCIILILYNIITEENGILAVPRHKRSPSTDVRFPDDLIKEFDQLSCQVSFYIIYILLFFKVLTE